MKFITTPNTNIKYTTKTGHSEINKNKKKHRIHKRKKQKLKVDVEGWACEFIMWFACMLVQHVDRYTNINKQTQICTRNLHHIIVSGDELYNDSEQYEHNTGKAYETGAGQTRHIFVETQRNHNANGNDKHNTKSHLCHRCVPRWNETYQYFRQRIADDNIVRDHCCKKEKKTKMERIQLKNLTTSERTK